MTWFGFKWPEKGWYAVKQNNQPTNQPTKLNTLLIIEGHLAEPEFWEVNMN